MDQETNPLTPPSQEFIENDKLFQPPLSHSGHILRFVVLGFVFFIILTAVAIGGYSLGASQGKLHLTASSKQTHAATTPRITVTPTPFWKLSFQDSISTYCPEVTMAPGSGYYTMDLAKLPIKTDSSVVTPATTGNFSPKCWGQKGQDYFFFQSTQGDGYNIFDDKSVELGHGGYPQIKPVGTKFYDKDNLTLYFLRVQQIGSYIGTEPIVIKGFKKLIWPTGENVYITTGKNAILATDPRLLHVLNTYATPGTDDFSKGHMIVDPNKEQQVEDVIKNTFFANPDALQNPEKEAVSTVISNLNAFSVK